MELDDKSTADQSRYFSTLLCHQIIWAIVEDSRKYFANQLLLKDFLNIVDAADILLPRWTLAEIESNVWYQMLILWPSFPIQWLPTVVQQASVYGGGAAHMVSAASQGPGQVHSRLPTPGFPPVSVLAQSLSMILAITLGSMATSPHCKQICLIDVRTPTHQIDHGTVLTKFCVDAFHGIDASSRTHLHRMNAPSRVRHRWQKHVML